MGDPQGDIPHGSPAALTLSERAAQKSRSDSNDLALDLVEGNPDFVEERVQVDRRKLENMISQNGHGRNAENNFPTAEDFFSQVMNKTGATVCWPTRLKIGAKTKKAQKCGSFFSTMAHQNRSNANFTSQKSQHAVPPLSKESRMSSSRSHQRQGREGSAAGWGTSYEMFGNGSYSGGVQGAISYQPNTYYEPQSYHRNTGWNRPPRMSGFRGSVGLQENDFRESSLRFGMEYGRKFSNPRIPFIQRKTLLDTFITRDNSYWVSDAKDRILAMLKTRNRVTLKMDVPYTDHSHIIGRSGRNTQAVMKETGCHIHFPDSNKNSDFEKSNQVSIAGPMEGVESSRRQIRNLAPLSITFELKNVRETEKVNQLLHNPAVEFDTGTPDITVLVRPNRSSGQPFVLIRGSVNQEDSIRKAYERLFAMLFHPEAEVECALSLDIMPDQQQSVLGPNSLNMNIIANNTKALIHFPPMDRKGATTFYIKGSIDGIMSARKQILAFLPISLNFELNGEPSYDIQSVETTGNVKISLKPKRGSDTVKCVTVKTQEWNTSALYVARDQILGLVGKTPPVVCREYAFMHKFHFPPQFAQTSPDSLSVVSGMGMRLSPGVIVGTSNGLVISPTPLSPLPPPMLPAYPTGPPQVSPLNGVLLKPVIPAFAAGPPSALQSSTDPDSTTSSSVSTSQSDEASNGPDGCGMPGHPSVSSEVSSTPKRSVGSSSTARQLSITETTLTEGMIQDSHTNISPSQPDADSPICKALLSASGHLVTVTDRKPIGAERGKAREAEAYLARGRAPYGQRYPTKDFCGEGWSQSHGRFESYGNDLGIEAHMADLRPFDEVFESESESRDKVGDILTPRLRTPRPGKKFGASAFERPSSLPRGGEGICLEESAVRELKDADPLAALLILNGLGKCIPVLQREEVDLKTFLMLTEEDLKEMEFSLGVRRVILCLIQEKRAEAEREV